MKRLSDSEIEKYAGVVDALVGKMAPDRRDVAADMLNGWAGDRFMTAPASAREEHHSAYPGGLVVHSLAVVSNLKRLSDGLAPGRWSMDTLSLVGLFHDLGKVGTLEEPLYLPNSSSWHLERGINYEVNPCCPFMTVAERSLWILGQHGLRLSEEEHLAIRLSEGPYLRENEPYRMREPDLALLLHFADRWSVAQEKASG